MKAMINCQPRLNSVVGELRRNLRPARGEIGPEKGEAIYNCGDVLTALLQHLFKSELETGPRTCFLLCCLGLHLRCQPFRDRRVAEQRKEFLKLLRGWRRGRLRGARRSFQQHRSQAEYCQKESEGLPAHGTIELAST